MIDYFESLKPSVYFHLFDCGIAGEVTFTELSEKINAFHKQALAAQVNVEHLTAMIYPQKNKLIRWFFHNYILRIVWRDFQDVKFNDVEIDNNKSILLLANHFSWWDGFLMYYINHKAAEKRNFHVMVIEETLQKVGFFKYMGAFSVTKGSREILTSLDYAAALLNDPKNVVLIFPQGKLHSNFIDEVKFEKGLSRIVKKAAGKYQTVLSVTFVENFKYKKPSANVYLKVIAEQKDGDNVINLQHAYQQHYNNALQQQNQITV